MRVAVVGAGISGLTAIKCCLDEGLEPVCFERTGEIGGLWRYKEETTDGQGCVMKSTVINVSKEMMSYSDFPVPERFPIFMHNTQVVEYFEMYAEKHGLLSHIKYNTEVLMIKKAEDFDMKGQWSVQWRNKLTGEEVTEIFDAVLVCTGHHADKHQPDFPGIKDFKGRVVHSHDYRHPGGYQDARALVVGIGNSGSDVAVELSRVAKQVYLSTRRGTWILHRVSDGGLPLDMYMTRRAALLLRELLPKSWTDAFLRYRLNKRINHDTYHLRPDYEPFDQHPNVNDDMPNRIICGSIKVKADIKRFTETGVEFVDGSKEDDIDTVVLATGYSFGFPFIDKDVIDVQDNQVDLYLNTFLPGETRQTLAVVGCVQGFGAITPAVELQCRAATRVFRRVAFLPATRTMRRAVDGKRRFNKGRYAQSRRHTIQVEILEFIDGFMDLAGCSIRWWELLTSDPRLFAHCFFGPLTPYQSRLFGPGKWSGARDAIMGQWGRVLAPLNTRPMTRVTPRGRPVEHVVVIVYLVAFYLLLHWMFS